MTVSEELLSEMESEIHPGDQMIRDLYTSGSMALPKGVKHNHGPALFRTHYLRSMLKPERRQQIVVALPMFLGASSGLMMYLLPNWEAGATSICTEKTFRTIAAWPWGAYWPQRTRSCWPGPSPIGGSE